MYCGIPSLLCQFSFGPSKALLAAAKSMISDDAAAVPPVEK
jgi:hypothetical protein